MESEWFDHVFKNFKKKAWDFKHFFRDEHKGKFRGMNSRKRQHSNKKTIDQYGLAYPISL